jgi:hypothetical protein
MTKLRILRMVLLFSVCLPALFAPVRAADIVFNCHNANPTRSEVQSKVWFAKGAWWAWLPYGDSGGRLWRRGADEKWSAEEHLDLTLQILPGQADVWAEENDAVGAMVEDSLLSIVNLGWSDKDSRYEATSIPLVWTEPAIVSTVTIAREGKEAFWVAYPVDREDGRRVVVRRALPDLRWPIGRPIVLAHGLENVETCAITAVDGGVGVMWTDRVKQGIYLRRHTSQMPDSVWSPTETVAEGDKIAGGQIHLCRPNYDKAPRLLAVSRTGQDQAGQPVLSLRTLGQGGQWQGVTFGELTKEEEPSRPTVVWAYRRPVALFTLIGPSVQGFTMNRIMLQQFSADGSQAVGQPIEVMPQGLGLNYATGPKVVPEGLPCVLLASDNQGNVIESVIEMATKGAAK